MKYVDDVCRCTAASEGQDMKWPVLPWKFLTEDCTHVDDGTLCDGHVCHFFIVPTFCDLLDMLSSDVIPPNFMISLKDGAPSWTYTLTCVLILSSRRVPVSHMQLHTLLTSTYSATLFWGKNSVLWRCFEEQTRRFCLSWK